MSLTYVVIVMGDGFHHTTANRVAIVDENGVLNKSADNKLRVSSTPYLYDIAEGKIAGHQPFAKLGFNGDVDTAEEDIWTQGGKYVFPSGATAMEVVSSAAGDAAAGTGIQQVRISYLDDKYLEQSEIVTLNGVAAVAMVARPNRVNAIRAYRVGANKVAAGTILVRGAGGGTTYRAISTGQTRGRGLIYTVPSNKTLYITDMNLSSSSQTALRYVLFTLRANYNDQRDVIVGWMEPFFEIINVNVANSYAFNSPLKIPSTCDLVMSGIGSDNNNICSVSVRGWLETV